MQIAYLDCASGISGDMMLGALVDTGADLAAIQAGIDSLGLPSCRLVADEVQKQGFRALKVDVRHEPEHKHRHLHHIIEMIDRGEFSQRAKNTAKSIFERLAEAEAKVHGSTIEKVHFHEVGAVDSIADIVGTAIGWDLLGLERAMASPIPTGRGHVQIAHGRCSIPAPATAELLCGIPLAECDVEGELTTPTGAAIVATLVERFGPLPAMTIERIGYGAGQKDFEHPNLLRLLIGAAASDTVDGSGKTPRSESIVVLETNLDDVSGEAIAHAMRCLLEAGALDVSTMPIQMKKGRPGVLLSVQARPADVAPLETIMFRETTTLGVRRSVLQRTALIRELHEVETAWGLVAGKIAYLPDGSRRFSPEYEACRAIAESQHISLQEVYAAAHRAFESN